LLLELRYVPFSEKSENKRKLVNIWHFVRSVAIGRPELGNSRGDIILYLNTFLNQSSQLVVILRTFLFFINGKQFDLETPIASFMIGKHNVYLEMKKISTFFNK